MPFTVQASDGNHVAGANSYITVAFFRDYHTQRGNALPAAAAQDSAVEQALVRATDYLDGRFRFVGQRVYGREQSTEWPRSDARDADGYDVNGVPPEVMEAVAEYALRSFLRPLNPDPTRDASGAVVTSRSEQVGPIAKSVTLAAGGNWMPPKYPAADQKLRRAGLVRSGGELLRA